MTQTERQEHLHRVTRLNVALGVLDKRIRRAAEHGLDAATVRGMHEALVVVASNLEDEVTGGVTYACRQCGAPHAQPVFVCARCWSRLEALTSLEPS